MNKEIGYLKADLVLNKTYSSEIRSKDWISQCHFQLSLHHISTDPEDVQKPHEIAGLSWRLLTTSKQKSLNIKKVLSKSKITVQSH